MRTLALALLALAPLGLGCASSRALQEAQAQAEVANVELARLRVELTAASSERDKAVELLRSDPDRSAQLTLATKLSELRTASEQLAAAQEANEKLRKEIEKLGLSIASSQKALADYAGLEAMRALAAKHLNSEGFSIGRVKARVDHDFATYVVLDLKAALGEGLMIVEQRGGLGWNQASFPNEFWFKRDLMGVKVLDEFGKLNTVCKATIYDYQLEERILRAAGR